MAIIDEVRITVEDFRPIGGIFTKRGWALKDAAGNHAVITSYRLAKLIKQGDIHLVTHKHAWDELVGEYRGTKHADGKAKLKEERAAKAKELERLGKELGERKQKAQQHVGRDPKKASELLREAAVIQQKGEALQGDIRRLDQEIAKK